MNKNQKILIAIIAILVVISGIICLKTVKKEKNKPVKQVNIFKEEYEALNGVSNDEGKTYPTVVINNDVKVQYKTPKEILEVVKKGTGLIYFGFATNADCRNIIEPLLSAVDSTGLENLYYVNIKDIRDSLSVDDDGNIKTDKVGTEEYNNLLEKFDEILNEYYVIDSMGESIDTNEKRIEVPLVVAIEDGKIIDYHLGTIDGRENDSYNELTNEEKEDLYAIYTSLILELTDSACDEGNQGC